MPVSEQNLWRPWKNSVLVKVRIYRENSSAYRHLSTLSDRLSDAEPDLPGSVKFMCGIVGYIGAQTSSTAQEVVLSGLERLEYRGYDSAGVAVLDGECVAMRKRAGRVADLRAVLAEEPLAQSPAAIGHTRWATHGIPSDRNSHPHLSADGRVAIVHNGIIENAPQLRNDLIAQGIEFASDTDSEVIAHMLGKAVAERGDLTQAMLGVVAP